MSWIVVIVLGVLVVTGACTLYGNRSGGRNVSQEQLLEWMEKSECCVLDVRSPGEYNLGHIPGAISIDYKTISTHLHELEPYKDKNIVVYCDRGGRARISQNTLIKAGFSNVYHLTGDMAAWRNAGQATEMTGKE